ncbi:MAG: hypothetical protein A2X12_08520 [Bacteroidetes bacterium GWE2_29_8]|nr:MAG: hypothetical protein A2X12_08520 [Bacteroidetes bacterium GWE2_29_8]
MTNHTIQLGKDTTQPEPEFTKQYTSSMRISFEDEPLIKEISILKQEKFQQATQIEALEERLSTLSELIKTKDQQIQSLKEENNQLNLFIEPLLSKLDSMKIQLTDQHSKYTEATAKFEKDHHLNIEIIRNHLAQDDKSIKELIEKIGTTVSFIKRFAQFYRFDNTFDQEFLDNIRQIEMLYRKLCPPSISDVNSSSLFFPSISQLGINSTNNIDQPKHSIGGK